MSLIWSHLTREEISTHIEQGVVTAILPFGSTEQHGPHLMTGNDYLFAERLALDLAARFRAFVLPPIPYGMADHHMGFTGTITVSTSTLIALLTDVARSIEKSGIRNLIISNGHGGNYSLILEFANSWQGSLKIHHDASERLLFRSATPFLDEFSAAAMGVHAGLQETAIAMHTHPEFGVRPHRLEPGAMPAGTEWTPEEMRSVIREGLHTLTPNGTLGDPRMATPELGRRFYESMLEMYVRFYEEKGLSLHPKNG